MVASALAELLLGVVDAVVNGADPDDRAGQGQLASGLGGVADRVHRASGRVLGRVPCVLDLLIGRARRLVHCFLGEFGQLLAVRLSLAPRTTRTLLFRQDRAGGSGDGDRDGNEEKLLADHGRW